MAGNAFLAGFGPAFAQALQQGQRSRDDQIRQQIQMLQLRQLLQQEQQNQAFGNLDLSQFGPGAGVSQPQPVGEPMSGAAGLGGPMPQMPQQQQIPPIRGRRSSSGGGMGFDIPALYDLAVKSGYQPGEPAAKAAAIGMVESSGNPQAHNTRGEDSRGLMQINADAWGPLATFDPNQNMANSVKISKGGTDFSPWSAYKSGAYQQYMPAALAAARARGGSSTPPAQEGEGGGGGDADEDTAVTGALSRPRTPLPTGLTQQQANAPGSPLLAPPSRGGYPVPSGMSPAQANAPGSPLLSPQQRGTFPVPPGMTPEQANRPGSPLLAPMGGLGPRSDVGGPDQVVGQAAPPQGVQRTQYQPGQQQMDPVTKTYNDMSVKLREYDAKMQQLGIPRTNRLYQNGLQQIQQAWKPYLDNALQERNQQRSIQTHILERQYDQSHQGPPAPQMKEFINEKTGEVGYFDVRPGFKPPPGYLPQDIYKERQQQKASNNIEVTDDSGKVIFSGGAHQTAQGWIADKDQKPVPEGDIKILGRGSQGRQAAAQVQSMIGASSELVGEVKNLMELPSTATAGIFQGLQNVPASELGEAVKRTLANKLTPEEQTDLKTSFQGVSRSLATIEAQGRATGLVGLTAMSEQLMPQENDTLGNRLRKLATLRQILERNTDAIKSSPNATREQKALLDQLGTEIKTAIPFTVSDVNKLQHGDKESLSVAAQKFGLGPQPQQQQSETAPAVPGVARQSGDVGYADIPGAQAPITATGPGGQKLILQNGQWIPAPQ